MPPFGIRSIFNFFMKRQGTIKKLNFFMPTAGNKALFRKISRPSASTTLRFETSVKLM